MKTDPASSGKELSRETTVSGKTLDDVEKSHQGKSRFSKNHVMAPEETTENSSKNRININGSA